jgi:hypothetical protein
MLKYAKALPSLYKYTIILPLLNKIMLVLSTETIIHVNIGFVLLILIAYGI